MIYLFAIMMGLFQAQFPKTAPIDVPPIQEEYGKPGFKFCDMGQCSFYEDDKVNELGMTPIRRSRITCADKTRFLMTAEDGSKHCIKLQ